MMNPISSYISHTDVNVECSIPAKGMFSIFTKNKLETPITTENILQNPALISSSDGKVVNECTGKYTSSKKELQIVDFKWKLITRINLNLRYAIVFSKTVSEYVLRRLEDEIEYFSGDLLKVRVFGKWHKIPRKQVAFGDDGLSYAFSGNSLPAKPWDSCPIILQLKNSVESITGESFNFVLVNRYANGADHIGEHRDDEKELVAKVPIASLSFGEEREFIFRHKDSRGKNAKRNIPPLKMELESGSVLLMDYPTNKFWYHSLPARKKSSSVRINLTFRKMISK